MEQLRKVIDPTRRLQCLTLNLFMYATTTTEGQANQELDPPKEYRRYQRLNTVVFEWKSEIFY